MEEYIAVFQNGGGDRWMTSYSSERAFREIELEDGEIIINDGISKEVARGLCRMNDARLKRRIPSYKSFWDIGYTN